MSVNDGGMLESTESERESAHLSSSMTHAPGAQVRALTDGIGVYEAPMTSPFLLTPAPYVRRAEFLPFALHTVGAEEIEEVVDTLRSAWITTGPKTKRFETELARFVSAPAALALSSCTAALHTALATAGIGAGDEVITTPLTFAATLNTIEHVGARPVLADVEPDTLNIDPARVEAAITDRTKAIVPVHFAGHPADLDPLRELAEANDLVLLEDAAHAFPAWYKGRMIGSGANPAAFSFYAIKNLTTAEGGMLTAAPEFIDRARVMSLHGMSRDAWKRYGKGGTWQYEITQAGFKYNMTDIQASLGLCQLNKIQRFHQRRRDIVAMYRRSLGACDALEMPTERPTVESAWHLFVLRLVPEALTIDRARFIEELAERNVGTSVHFIPNHLQPYYRDKYGYIPQSFPVALSNYERMLSLPLNPRLRDEDVADVIEAVLDVVRAFRR
jgi:dTDP-4-amino-4,6-dideoxygalactose transaminase